MIETSEKAGTEHSARIQTRLLSLLILLLPPLLVFWPVTFGGKSLIPFDALAADPMFRTVMADAGVQYIQNDLVADLVFQNLIWKEFLVETLQRGEIPLWNPYILGGLPFLAAGQHSGLYPLSLIFLLITPHLAFGWNALFSIWLAGLGMYVLGKVLGLRRPARLLMGLAWSMSSLFTINAVFPMIQAGMSYGPLILAGIHVLTRAGTGSDKPEQADDSYPDFWHGRSLVWLIIIAAGTGLTALAGHPEMLIYTGLICGAYSVFRLTRLGRLLGSARTLLAALSLGLSAGIGIALAGVQLIPLIELASANFRSAAIPYAEIAGQHAFGLRQLATFILPNFYGNPAHHAVPAVGGMGAAILESHAMWGTAWGARNYVESASYIGILPMALALLGLAAFRGRSDARAGLVGFFALLALFSLSFIFVFPSYRLLYHLIPGIDQLRTPFRWVYGLNLALLVLAGLGLDALLRGKLRRLAEGLGATMVLTGGFGGILLAACWFTPERWLRLIEIVFRRLGGAEDAALQYFPSLESFAAYQYWNALHLVLFLSLSGVAIFVLSIPQRDASNPLPRTAWRWILPLMIVGLDLGLTAKGFNPATDPALSEVQPRTLTELREISKTKWGRISVLGEEKTLWPNTAMRSRIPDLRAYDSILPKASVESVGRIEDQQGMLRYNRIDNLKRLESLTHPMLRALGVRYILSRQDLAGPGLKSIRGGDLKIYENENALQRAWVVNEVQVLEDREDLLDALAFFDPESEVLLETWPEQETWNDLPAGRDIPTSTQVRKDTEKNNELEVEVEGAPSGGMLVLSEAYFPGWRAWVTVGGGRNAEEIEVPVYRANGMLRAVPVPPGHSVVRLKYLPMSFKLGLYLSFLGGISLLLIVGFALWRRLVKVDGQDEMGLIAVNSAGPIAAGAVNKIMLFAFAALSMRILGPELQGQYFFAINIFGFAEILSNFGLNILAAREVARRPELAGRYLSQTVLLRLILWAVTLPLIGAYLYWGSQAADGGGPALLAEDTVRAVLLLMIALIPASLNSGISSIFWAKEKRVLPEAVSIISTLITISFGALVLLLGWGYVGLAGVAVFTNWITFFILAYLAGQHGIRPEWKVRPAFIWGMAAVALPLMLNHLLQTVFFRIDIQLLKHLVPANADTVLGWYDAAYKWVNALLIIPSMIIMALFPLLSRRASEDREGLVRAYIGTRRWLLSTALILSVLITFLAEDMVWLVGGGKYLPQGAAALKVLIWFLPLSFVNGLAQYVLIALDRQRWITLSFVFAALFNIVANWIVIPPPGIEIMGIVLPASYLGAATVTIISEFVLWIPFAWGLRDLKAPPLLVTFWRPAIAAAAAAMLLAYFDSQGWSTLLAALLALPMYLVLLRRLGGITDEDTALIKGRLGRILGFDKQNT